MNLLTRYFDIPTHTLIHCWSPWADCSGQDEQFSLVFTIASFMCSFMTLPNGFMFDRFGTTVARLVAM